MICTKHRVWPFPRAFFLTVCLTGASSCARNGASPSDAGTDAGAEASVAAPIVTNSVAPKNAPRVPEPDDRSIPPLEARRNLVQKVDDDPILAKQRDGVLGFYKENVPSPLVAQFEALPGDRMAIFLADKRELAKPFVMFVEANGTRAWTKEMPLAGIVPGVRDIAIVRGEDASVGLAFCDSTGKMAALRTWHADGSINADHEVMETAHCDFISAVYVPGAGHLVAAAGEETAQIGKIAANGMRVWDRAGMTLPWIAAPRTALTIAVDTDNSFVVIGAGSKKEGKTEGVGILAMRFDLQGKQLWQAPVSVVRKFDPPPERLTARVVGPGKIEIDLPEKPAKRAELTAEGIVVVSPAKS